MKRRYGFLIAVLCLTATLFSCDLSGISNVLAKFKAKDKIGLPFASLQKLGKINTNEDIGASSIAGCYTYHEDIKIDGSVLTVYLGLQLTSEGKIKSFYAVSQDRNSSNPIAWHKDSGGDVWEVNFIVGMVNENEEEKGVLMLSDADGNIIGVLFYVFEKGKLILSDGTEDGIIELVKVDDNVFDGATDPTEDFYGSGTEDDPYRIGWVNVDGAVINEKLEGCFVCNDFDDASIKYGIKFELKKQGEDITEARIYEYFTRDDFVKNGKNVYAYDFQNPENKGMLCKFKERSVDPVYHPERKVIHLIIWEKDYKDECCGQIPIYFATDENGNVTEFWLDSCFDGWLSRYNHDGDNAKYFYHYVKSDDESIFNGAFNYGDYLCGKTDF